MRRFILAGVVGMVLVLGVVVVVWWYLQQELFVPQPSSLEIGSSPLSPESNLVSSSTAPVPVAATATSTDDAPPTSMSSDTLEGGVAVRDLPLTPEQQQVAESLGFDTTQMVLSPTLVACARDTLGESRYQAIIAGDTPTFFETARLLPCVSQ